MSWQFGWSGLPSRAYLSRLQRPGDSQKTPSGASSTSNITRPAGSFV